VPGESFANLKQPPPSPSSPNVVPIQGSSLVLEAVDGDVFRAHVPLSTFRSLGCGVSSSTAAGDGGGSGSGGSGGDAFVVARAVVDESWGKAPGGSKPNGAAPQSHLANARTNPEWKHEVNGHVVQVLINAI
jgi:hypothetical protein